LENSSESLDWGRKRFAFSSNRKRPGHV